MLSQRRSIRRDTLKFVFEAHIKAGHTEAEYSEAWERGSSIIQRQPGAQGTMLHRKIGEPGVLLAIASWESLAARNTAMAALAKVDETTRSTLDRHEALADIRCHRCVRGSRLVGYTGAVDLR